MNPNPNIEITGTVTRLNAETSGEAGGAVLVAHVEQDTRGAALPDERIGRAWLRLPASAVEHLLYRLHALSNPPALYSVADDLANLLDEANGLGGQEVATRMLKVGEEFGEAISAWIGTTAQNPRTGATHTSADVADELADVVMAALVAITSLGHHPEAVMARAVAKVSARVREARS